MTSLETLTAWAEARGLRVRASSGSQRDPENVVAVVDGERLGATVLLRRQSLDSIDTAAMYVINSIDRLRLEDRMSRNEVTEFQLFQSLMTAIKRLDEAGLKTDDLREVAHRVADPYERS